MQKRYAFKKEIISICVITVALLLLAHYVGGASRAESNTNPPVDVLNRPTNRPNEGRDVSEITIALPATNIEQNNCRFGVSGHNTTFDWIDTVGVGWASNYYVSSNNLASSSYHAIIRLKGTDNFSSYTSSPGLSQLSVLAAQNPGVVWQVGNEPDVPGQDNMTPELYARAYGEVYAAIKSADPTALITNGPLSMATPSRLQYLDIVWETYRELYGTTMPVDIWNTHLYMFHEWAVAIGTDPSLAIKESFGDTLACALDDVTCIAEHDSSILFEQQLRDLRQWLKDHGQQDKPLVLSEWSILWPYVIDNPGTPQESCFMSDEYGQCFTPSRVNRYMDATIDVMEKTDTNLGYPKDNYRLVQKHMWFSTFVDPEFSGGGGASSFLKVGYEGLTAGGTDGLTAMGLNYKRNIDERALGVNLYVADAQASSAIADNSGLASVDLKAIFTNNGNSNIQSPFKVSFYSDASMTQLIGQETVVPEALGCGVNQYEATVRWENRPVGLHSYWVKVDSGNVINELNESNSDNVIQGKAFVGNTGVYLPIVVK